MGLRDIISDVESREKTIAIHGATPELADAVREYFAAQNVRVVHESLADGASPRVVVSGEDSAAATVDVRAVEELVSGTVNRDVGDGVPYSDLLVHLDRTTFTSYDRAQMLAASREIEDRAWRVRRGRLAAGFQTFSRFATQRGTYRTLADTDLDVHVYGVPDVDVTDAGTTLHGIDDPEIASTWFVAFDGGPDPTQKSALLAEERAPGTFYGFWTYEEGVVDRVFEGIADVVNRASA